MHWLARFIYFKVLGWKVVGNTNFEATKKAVLIGVPHTHWQDFVIGILLRSAIGVEANFIGKKSLFNPPFGWIFRRLGGAPVERKRNENQVESIARVFKNKEVFRLGMSPEGTREKVEKWRTGFYYIAKTAKVPIIMFTLDFENKENRFSDPFWPTDDKEADFKFMKSFYKNVKGKVHEYS